MWRRRGQRLGVIRVLESGGMEAGGRAKANGPGRGNAVSSARAQKTRAQKETNEEKKKNSEKARDAIARARQRYRAKTDRPTTFGSSTRLVYATSKGPGRPRNARYVTLESQRAAEMRDRSTMRI